MSARTVQVEGFDRDLAMEAGKWASMALAAVALFYLFATGKIDDSKTMVALLVVAVGAAAFSQGRP